MADHSPLPGAEAELQELAQAVEALRMRLGHIYAVGEDPEAVRDSPFAHLFERVRAEVGERRHGATEGAVAALELPRLEPLRVAAPASLTPPPPITIRDEYTLGELLSHEGEDFVANAYRALLGREAEPGGMAHWLDVLYAGDRSKTELLAEFRGSDEGRRRGAVVHGLARAARLQRWRRLPVIGYMIAVLHLILRLPTMARDLEHQEMLLFRRKRELRATIAAVEALGARDAAALDAFAGVLQALNRTKASRESTLELGGRVAALRYEIGRLDAELQRRAKGAEVLRIGQAMTAAADGLRSTLTAIGERTDELPRLRGQLRESDRRVEALAAALDDLALRKAEAAAMQARFDVAEQALSAKAEAAEVEARFTATEQALSAKAAATEVETRFAATEQALSAKAEAAEVVPRLGAAEEALRRKAEVAEVEPRLEAAEEALRGKAEAARVEPRLDAVEEAMWRKAETAELLPRFEAAEEALRGKAEAGKVEPRLDAVEEALWRKAEIAELVPRFEAAEEALRGKAEAAKVEPRLDAVEDALWRKAETAELLPRFEAMQQGLDAKAEGSEVERRLGELSTRAGLEAILAQDGHELDQFYMDFEDRFRGTRGDIRARVAVYLPHVTELGAGTEHAPILDVGCGRGEWLELLRDSGLVARGLDLNARMVESCRELGLEVEEAEAVAYLEGLEEASLGAITAMHVIEHMPFRQRVRFLDAALRALRPGGLAIFETPNPENLMVGSCSFWNDPTHVSPLPPETTRAIAELRGFSRAEIVRLHPLPPEAHLPATGTPVRDTLNHLLSGPQDYAILAYKPVLEDAE